MRLIIKENDLKKEIEKDIEAGNYDTNKFVEYIKNHLDKANFLLENKILDLESKELYDALKELFSMKYDNEDYLEILSDLYGKHYTDIISIKTNMIDENGYNIEYIGARTKKLPNYNNRVYLSELRNITNSYEFIVLKQQKHKLNDKLKQEEKYENHQYINFDTNLDEKNELFDEVLNLIRRTIKDKKVFKQVLSDLKKYIDNLMHQAKEITKLSESDNPQVRQIGLLYKNALENNFNKKSLTQKNNHKRRY